MPNLLNYSLFSLGNMIAVGAIVFFWGCAVYALTANVSVDVSEPTE